MSDFAIDKWMADSRQITQPFGVNPEVYAQFGAPGHTGIDLGGVEGVTNIYAVRAGTVSVVRKQSNGFGNHVYIKHASGYTTIYGHLHSITVRQGQAVSAGTVIGKLGNTGFSSGPHLHFELRGPNSQTGWPRNINDPTPYTLPHLGFSKPAGPYKSGWVINWAITAVGDLAQVNAGGVSLRSGAGQSNQRLNVVPQGTMMIVTGGEQNEYIPVDVPYAALGEQAPNTKPKTPSPEFPPMVSTIDGWGFATAITSSDGIRGVAGEYGINLRASPSRTGTKIGLLRGGSSVTITGAQSGEYIPVTTARNDFIGAVNEVQAAPSQPQAGTLAIHGAVTATTCLGWGWADYMDIRGEKAITGEYGINLRSAPNNFGSKIGVVKGMATVTIVGKPSGEYIPVMVNRADMLTIENPNAKVDIPDPIEDLLEDSQPHELITPEQSTPGWAFGASVTIEGECAIAGQYGINLRAEPRRDAAKVGLVPAGSAMIIVGERQGEYIAVRVDDEVLQTGDDNSSVMSVDPPLLGKAKLGLHASATPDIGDAEFGEFKALRPGMIKVLSFHSGEDIRRLAKDHPSASWVVRAFLEFGGRNVTPDQFVEWTIGDTRRALNQLQGKDVVVELHNEPNLSTEGWKSTWADGAAFNRWWLQVLGKYRQQLPGVRYIFPGLSPGPDAAAYGGQRTADRAFLEACRPAINAADGLAMHSYWSSPSYPMLSHPDSGTMLVDDYIRRFPAKPIWITEASNNHGKDWNQKGRDYIQFWQEMQKRPTVQGVTYFVASALPGTFTDETWLGNGIAAKLGAR